MCVHEFSMSLDVTVKNTWPPDSEKNSGNRKGPRALRK